MFLFHPFRQAFPLYRLTDYPQAVIALWTGQQVVEMYIFVLYIRKQLQFLKRILIPSKILFRLVVQCRQTHAFFQILRIQRINVQVTNVGIRIHQKMVGMQIGKIFKMFPHHGKKVLLFMCDPIDQQGLLRFRQLPKVHAA